MTHVRRLSAILALSPPAVAQVAGLKVCDYPCQPVAKVVQALNRRRKRLLHLAESVIYGQVGQAFAPIQPFATARYAVASVQPFGSKAGVR